jgi:GNAT superfamily N-acetyltransferase
MENITIRKATERDLDTLYEFEQGVIEAERPFDTTLRAGLIHYYDLTGLISSPRAQLVVAELGSRVIASGYARIVESVPYLQHTHHAYLGFMFVVPDHRGKGVNKMVMEELKRWAKEQNINELRLEVYVNNASAIKAYEKLGFIKHMLEMRYKND